MLSRIKNFAKKSKTSIIARRVYSNWRAGSRFQSGNTESECGSIHSKFSLLESLAYINQVFDDYLTYSGLSSGELHDKAILEIGPGDNLGVALKFLIAGAKQVVCLDKFFSSRNLEQQRSIYRALRESLGVSDRRRFDDAIVLDQGCEINPDRIRYVHGIGIEEAGSILEPQSFDLIISRAVMEHVYDPDAAFVAMNRLLVPGGHMIHKIDLRDHGLLSGYGHHPLTFFTIPDKVYRLMSRHTGNPNRRTISYYRQKMAALGYGAKIFITHIVGSEEELLPHREIVAPEDERFSAALSLLKTIRPQLSPTFKKMPEEELMVAGIFLVAKKPESSRRQQ